jgi:hypothetical protein
MKPFFRDNMCMGNTKQELFFETGFLVCFIENHLLNFTVPSYSINQFDYFLSQSPSFSASNKSKLSPSQTSSSLSQIKDISGLYPAIYFLGG